VLDGFDCHCIIRSSFGANGFGRAACLALKLKRRVDKLAWQAIMFGFFGVKQFGSEAGQQHEGNVDKALTN
jgi:hypothetical protein